MSLAKYFLLIFLSLPLAANEADDEIIKNLDFFQSMELVKDENPYALRKPNIINSINEQLFIQLESTPINNFPDSEKK